MEYSKLSGRSHLRGRYLNDQTVQKLEDGRYWTPDMDMTNIAPFALIKLIY